MPPTRTIISCLLAPEVGRALSVGALSVLLTSAVQAQTPTVTSLMPTRNAVAAPRTTPVTVTFDQPLSNTASTQQALKVFSQQAGGLKAGTATVSGNTLTFDPSQDFKPGETVQATLTNAVQSSSGQSLVKPQVFQFTTATAPSAGIFGGGSDLPVGTGSSRVALGDIDGDGDLDAVTSSAGNARANNGTVSIRLNNGAGSYGNSQPALPSSSAYGPVALADVDGDGDLDLLVVSVPTTVLVRLNNGQGSFSGTGQVTVSEGFDLAVGDLDGDGDLDLVTANPESRNSTASVRFNNGSGVFSGTGEVRFAADNSSVLLGDVDNDGDLDLLSAGSGTVVDVYLNNGSGSFSSNQVVTVGGTYPSYPNITLGDVDNDGDLDLVTANSGASSGQRLSVRLNNGGTFSNTGQDLALSSGPYDVALGDVDGDGDLDVTTATAGSNTVSVRLNNGRGAFSGTQEVSVGAYPNQVVLGDVDNNGTLDLFTVNYNVDTPEGAATASVRLNDHGVLAAASAQRATQLSLYPNPAHGTVQLALPATSSSTELQVELYNTLGQRVRRFSPANLGPQPTTLDVRGLAPGPYLLRLTGKQQTATRTLVLE